MSWTNEQERELLESLEGITKDLDKKYSLGVVNPDRPESYFRLLCFLISYKTGTSLYDIQYKFTLFDFVSYLYIVNKFTEETSDSVPNHNPTPESRDRTEMIGMV